MTTDPDVQRAAEELVKAAHGRAAEEADTRAREELSENELLAASASSMSPSEYLRFKSPRPEAP